MWVCVCWLVFSYELTCIGLDCTGWDALSAKVVVVLELYLNLLRSTDCGFSHEFLQRNNVARTDCAGVSRLPDGADLVQVLAEAFRDVHVLVSDGGTTGWSIGCGARRRPLLKVGWQCGCVVGGDCA